MTSPSDVEIFIVAPPGLESVLLDEVVSKGFASPTPIPGGILVKGGWSEVWRANLELRGASRILVRIATFPVVHLAQLDKRARRVPWAETLRPDVAVHVEAASNASRIYHAGAAAQRITTAIHEELGAPIADDAPVRIKARIDHDLCTISVDTSGEGLHKRDHKLAVAKAPMRESLASLFLRQCGYDGHEPVVDPMCGSGTFVIEAAEIAAGLKPGRSRHFAFEQLACFDDAAWQHMRAATGEARTPAVRFHGSDRDAGAIGMSRANADRAGVGEWTAFRQLAISDLVPPEGPPGLVIVNPPYGARLGEMKRLFPLYRALGQTLLSRFKGWRVGLLTTQPPLAQTTGLPFGPPAGPVLHGGLHVSLFSTKPLS